MTAVQSQEASNVAGFGEGSIARETAFGVQACQRKRARGFYSRLGAYRQASEQSLGDGTAIRHMSHGVHQTTCRQRSRRWLRRGDGGRKGGYPSHGSHSSLGAPFLLPGRSEERADPGPGQGVVRAGSGQGRGRVKAALNRAIRAAGNTRRSAGAKRARGRILALATPCSRAGPAGNIGETRKAGTLHGERIRQPSAA